MEALCAIKKLPYPDMLVRAYNGQLSETRIPLPAPPRGGFYELAATHFRDIGR